MEQITGGFEQFAKKSPEEKAIQEHIERERQLAEQELKKPARGRPKGSKSPVRNSSSAQGFAEEPSPQPKAPAPGKPTNEAKQREKLINQIKNYEKEYPKVLQPREWQVNDSTKHLEEVVADYGGQLTGAHQFEFGKMVFIKGAENLPSAMTYIYPDMDLTNLGPLTAANYDNVFAPTWKELIIKYDLFRFGPELRMFLLISDWLRMVDASNKQKQEKAVAPQSSNGKFEKL